MESPIKSKDWYGINEITTKIYASHPYPNLREIADNLKKLIPCVHTLSCLVSDSEGKVEFFHYQSSDMSEEQIGEYCSKYIYYDFILWYEAAPKQMVFRESDIIVERYMADSIFMREWMEPIGIYYGAVIDIAAGGHSYGNICLYRSHEDGDFSDYELDIMRVVCSHLCTRFGELLPNGIHQRRFDEGADEFTDAYHLTDREHELVQHVIDGVPRDKLADSLFISENTVKKHLNSIYHKMGIKGYSALVGMVKPVIKYFE